NLHWVNNGNEATLYLSGKGKYADRTTYPTPKLILLDLKLPVKNGFEVLQWIRSYASYISIPIVVLTDCFDERIVQRAYELGANSFLNKPKDLESLQKLLSSIREYWLSLNVSDGTC